MANKSASCTLGLHKAGRFNSMAEPVEAHCPHCDGDRWCDVHGNITKNWHHADRDGNSAEGGTHHSLLECRGCQTVFYEANRWSDQDLDYWHDRDGELHSDANYEKSTYPKPDSKTKPVWLSALYRVDEQLYAILSEMYLALDNKAKIITAIGLRTALDRATEVLGIHPSKSFPEKLAELKAGGWIGDTEQAVLGVVTDAGNAAAHRGWSPEDQEIALLVQVMESFLHKAFIIGKGALGIKARIPPKPPRP